MLHGPKVRELWEAVKVLCGKRFTMHFPIGSATPEPPPFPRFRGKAKYSVEGCVGCGACAQVCPAGAITVTDDLKALKRRLVLDYGRCIFCGTCERGCITQEGIKLSQEFDTAHFDRKGAANFESVEKDLAVCEGCGSAISGKDHLVWMADRLGAMAYTNPTLALAAQEKLGLAEAAPQLAAGAPQVSRGDLYRKLCPGCRRTVLLKEHWI
jgi:formate hydrogenlyase subunit 6/NADH:ubiquinone oxidoreductase subunit I